MASDPRYIIEKVFDLPETDDIVLTNKNFLCFLPDQNKVIFCNLNGNKAGFAVWDIMNRQNLYKKNIELKETGFAQTIKMIVSLDGVFIALVGGSEYFVADFVYIWKLNPADYSEFELIHSYTPSREDKVRYHLEWTPKDIDEYPEPFLNQIKIYYDFVGYDHITASISGKYFLAHKRLKFQEEYICLYKYDGYYEIRRNRFPNRILCSLEIAGDDEHAMTAGQGLMTDYGSSLTPCDSIYYWNLKTMDPERSFPTSDKYISCASFLKNGELIISGGQFGGIFAWDVNTGDCLASHPTKDGILFVQGSPTGDIFYSIDDYGQYALWKLKLD